jgi:hypothetical protein
LSNKTKNATVAEPKLFHQLNNPYVLLTCAGNPSKEEKVAHGEAQEAEAFG